MPVNITKPAPPDDELRQHAHLTNTAIAKIYGVSRPTVSIWLDAAGIRRLRRHVPIPSKAELEELYAKPMTQRDIGKKYGVSASVIKRWFSLYDIETRLGRWTAKLDPVARDYEFIGPDHELEHTPDPVPVPPPRTGKGKRKKVSRTAAEVWRHPTRGITRRVLDRYPLAPELEAEPVRYKTANECTGAAQRLARTAIERFNQYISLTNGQIIF